MKFKPKTKRQKTTELDRFISREVKVKKHHWNAPNSRRKKVGGKLKTTQ